MPQKLRTLSTGIEQRCISYFHQFSTNFYQPTQSSESVNDSESFSGSPSLVQQIVDEPANDIDNIKLYITESNRLLQAQFIATKLIIDENTASILQSKARNELTNPETAVIQFCLSKIPVIISKREITVLTQFFALCQYNLTTCDLIIENVLKQISEEPTELDKLIEAISFYHLICDKCFASNIKYKKMIHNGLYKLVNSQTKNIIINVLRRINTEALKDSPDISDLKELLNYFEQKTELISVHTRHAARRLVKNYDLQIDQETQIYAQLLHISDKFDLSQLKMLINGAEQSVNLHIGPVLIVNTSAWPFHPPYPNPLLLSDVASEITTKYNKLFTGRVLHFPINHWFVNVRDTVNGYVFVCTGVQAEILLYFNKHILIAETSLEPNIGQQFAVAALKAMADETAPVLRLKEDVYVMNQDFRYDRIVKLKQPAIRDEIAESKLVNDTKNNMMDSVIVREMKQKRVVNLRDIDALVKNALATRFSVSSEDIHKRIESLIAREYIEYFGKDKLRYLA
ncbi:Cullin-domain-containing protein [Histomonas meleagridis]|uniref:Cullin-domain-containing protein n=1 Tax=Histomonas meleagridis TaxID=135588 RepID=UPI00355A3B74|nr:Cullin-domain-containing protein [Histomonas meleagridis]KAH0796555.1 Cullin-domain-containing protein [Histomonas meleagridis]